MNDYSKIGIFDQWNIIKKEIDHKHFPTYVKEREIWWCHLGKNIGQEEDGKGF